jgi:hypothetical protein
VKRIATCTDQRSIVPETDALLFANCDQAFFNSLLVGLIACPAGAPHRPPGWSSLRRASATLPYRSHISRARPGHGTRLLSRGIVRLLGRTYPQAVRTVDQLNACFGARCRSLLARTHNEGPSILSLAGEGRFALGQWEVFVPAEAHRPRAVLSGAWMLPSCRRPQSGGREPSVQLRSGFRLTGASQKEIARPPIRELCGLAPEALGLFVEALLKGLIVFGA